MAQAQKLTSAQVKQIFGVSHMALLHWRNGTATKDPLPAHAENPDAAKSRIYFKEHELRKWAKKHGVEFKVDPAKVLAAPAPKAEKKAAPAKKATRKTAAPKPRAPRKSAAKSAEATVH